MNSLNVFTVGSGEKLVFCTSGMFAGSWMWNDFLDSIDKTHYKFFIMKDAICEISNNVEEVAKLVEYYLISNNIENLIIMGNSLGGLVSLIVTQERQELISKTIILGTPHSSVTLGLGIPRRNNKEWVSKLANKILFKEKRINEVTNQIFPVFSHRQTFLNMVGLSRTLFGENVTKYLNNISTPIYAVWGEKDEITPVSHWEEMPNLYNNFSLIKIENSGHSPVYEDPKRFAEIFTELTLKNK